jgi:hypothetical protein
MIHSPATAATSPRPPGGGGPHPQRERDRHREHEHPRPAGAVDPPGEGHHPQHHGGRRRHGQVAGQLQPQPAAPGVRPRDDGGRRQQRAADGGHPRQEPDGGPRQRRARPHHGEAAEGGLGGLADGGGGRGRLGHRKRSGNHFGRGRGPSTSITISVRNLPRNGEPFFTFFVQNFSLKKAPRGAGRNHPGPRERVPGGERIASGARPRNSIANTYLHAPAALPRLPAGPADRARGRRVPPGPPLAFPAGRQRPP